MHNSKCKNNVYIMWYIIATAKSKSGSYIKFCKSKKTAKKAKRTSSFFVACFVTLGVYKT